MGTGFLAPLLPDAYLTRYGFRLSCPLQKGKRMKITFREFCEYYEDTLITDWNVYVFFGDAPIFRLWDLLEGDDVEKHLRKETVAIIKRIFLTYSEAKSFSEDDLSLYELEERFGGLSVLDFEFEICAELIKLIRKPNGYYRLNKGKDTASILESIADDTLDEVIEYVGLDPEDCMYGAITRKLVKLDREKLYKALAQIIIRDVEMRRKRGDTWTPKPHLLPILPTSTFLF